MKGVPGLVLISRRCGECGASVEEEPHSGPPFVDRSSDSSEHSASYALGTSWPATVFKLRTSTAQQQRSAPPKSPLKSFRLRWKRGLVSRGPLGGRRVEPQQPFCGYIDRNGFLVSQSCLRVPYPRKVATLFCSLGVCRASGLPPFI